MALTDIYPEEWLKEQRFKMSKNLMVVSYNDREALNDFMKNPNYESLVNDVSHNRCHPFDEITYVMNGVIMDFRNNLASEEFVSMARIVIGADHLGNIGYSQNGEPISIDGINERASRILKEGANAFWELNLLIGCYTLSCHSRRKSRRVGTSTTNVTERSTNSNKPRTIRIKDIPTLQFSTFIDGRGSKPSHEFSVRGHIRHYKNGREVFIKSYTKCKGRGTQLIQSYSIGGEKDGIPKSRAVGLPGKAHVTE